MRPQLHLADGHLRCGGELIVLSPKERAVISALAESGGQPVSIERLIETVWGERPIGTESLHRCISTLRGKLAGCVGERAIVSIYGFGYRLTVSVARDAAPERELGSDPQELFRQAMEALGRRSRPEVELASLRLGRLCAAHPDYLPAHAFSGHLQITLALNTYAPPREAGGRAVALARQILDRHPRSADALAISGFVAAVIEGRGEGLAELDGAVAAEPRNWLARFYRAWALAGHGRFGEAIDDLDAAWTVVPEGVGLIPSFAYVLHCAGEPERALAMLRQAQDVIRLSPAANAAHATVASCMGFHEEAIAAGRRAAEVPQVSATLSSALAFALARAGRLDDARRALAEIMDGPAGDLAPSMGAAVWLALGEAGRAIAELRRAEVECCPYRHMQRFDPRLAALHP